MAIDALSDLAAFGRAQHGLVTRTQAQAAGLAGGTLQRWLAERRLERIHPGVYRMAGTPRTWEQSVLAAVLAAGTGAAASHRTAGLLWGLVEEAEGLVELSVPRARAIRILGAVVHRSSDLTPAWVAHRRSVPVTNPLLTLVDLGAVLPAHEVDDAMNRGLVLRLFSVAAVEWVRLEVGRPGRRGSGVLGRVLDDRALGDQRPDGLLEPRMARLMRARGLPPASFQFVVHDHGGRFVARVDFAYPEHRLAVEVDGYELRASPAAMQADLDRQNGLVRAGWTVLRFTWADVVRRPARVADLVTAALGRISATPRTESFPNASGAPRAG